MAIPWLVFLKSVPWGDVIGNAPKVADGAKKLWNAVSKKPAAPEASEARPAAAARGEPESLAALQARLAAMEAAIEDLHNQMLASTELIKALADQNAQLIKSVEANRVRVAWLTGAAVLFGAIALAGLALRLLA